MNYKSIILIVLVTLFFGCSSPKNSSMLPLDTNEEDIQYIKDRMDNSTFETTDFYKIVTIFDVKERYNINELKSFDLRIINYGQKELFIPKVLSRFPHGELKIEIFKKNKKGEYSMYKQSSTIVKSNNAIQPEMEREILSSKKGELICFKDLLLDRHLKIVDAGNYYAKIYIDLSNFGYFKTLQGSTKEFVVN